MRLGVDLGGTKIEIVALADDGRELLRRRAATPQGDYLATVMAIAGLVEAAEQSLGQRGTVGVGMPGAESPDTGRIKNANSTCLIGQPLRRDLQAVLQREVRLANDANCFALSEAVDGPGTGVGGGLVWRGHALTGANRIAGEWGHNPQPGEPAEGLPACYCGRQGCVETFLSGPGLAADHRRAGGAALEAAQIAAAAAAGEPCAVATLDRYCARLARALAVVINIVDPDVIVLGGGLSGIAALYDEVPRRWTPHVFSDTVRTRLLPPVHGDSSGVRGAAWLWNS